MKRTFQGDERTQAITGNLAFIILSLTHIGLYAAILIQRYAMQLPPPYYNDIALLLLLSLLGYWAPCLILIGSAPQLTMRRSVLLYLTLVLTIAIPHSLIRGLPQQGEWPLRLMVYLGLPALLIGFYAMFSSLGQHRIHQLLDQEETDEVKDVAGAKNRQDTSELPHE